MLEIRIFNPLVFDFTKKRQTATFNNQGLEKKLLIFTQFG